VGHGRTAVQQKDFDLVILSKSLCPHLKLSHRGFDGYVYDGGAIGRPSRGVVGAFLGDVLARCGQGEQAQAAKGDDPSFGAMLGLHDIYNIMSEQIDDDTITPSFYLYS
jgi:hypothetical protein